MPKSSSFPLIAELPELLDTSDWLWEPAAHFHLPHDAWIGVDPEGRNWLLKMRVSFSAYREHVFASLAQRVGISCQSSVYVVIPSETAEPRLCGIGTEPCQLALWFMDEHERKGCSTACPLANLIGKSLNYEDIEQGNRAGIAHFHDLVRGDILGHLCGQFEPHAHFFTREHQYVVIDNELMFAESPCLRSCSWLESETARPLIIDVCRRIAGIKDDEFLQMTKIPDGYVVLYGRDLTDDLRAAKKEAIEYLEIFDETA